MEFVRHDYGFTSHSEIRISFDMNEYWSSYLTSGQANLSDLNAVTGWDLHLSTQPERVCSVPMAVVPILSTYYAPSVAWLLTYVTTYNTTQWEVLYLFHMWECWGLEMLLSNLSTFAQVVKYKKYNS